MASPDKFCEEITRNCLKDFRFIDQGAFGTIYRARHQDWGVNVAVKILDRDTACTCKELLNEARAMDKARFIYVIRLYGLFVDEGPPGSFGSAVPRLGLVMEFMENGSLASLQSQVPSMPWALRLRVLHEVALGMNFLHSLKRPLLHLDLKPSNVLLDGELHVRVADFGLSKCKRGSSHHSLGHGEGDGYGGTLEYMPPEAFADLNYKPSTGTDVYSYGILMWSLLTGKKPYLNIPPNYMSSLIKFHIPQGQRPSTEELEKMVAEVPGLKEMIGLMKHCWHNEKAQRPSFRDCTQKTESIYSSYKRDITAAVREVQDILVRMDSLPARERPSSGLTPHRASPVSCRPKCSQPQLTANSSLGLEERFETLQMQESPPRQNEAVPIKPSTPSNWKASPHLFQRSRSIRAKEEASEPHNGSPPHPGANAESRTGPRAASYQPPLIRRLYHQLPPLSATSSKKHQADAAAYYGLKSAGANFQHSSGCTPGARNLHRVPELSHFSDIPSDSVLNRSGGRRRQAGKLSRGTSDTDTGYGERSRSDFSNPPAKRLVLNYPELTDEVDDYDYAFSYTADEVDDYECDFNSTADEVDDYECTFNSTAVVRSTGKMESPTDPWEGVICDECPCEEEYTLEYLDPAMEQQYFEVNAKSMKEELQLCLMEKQAEEEEPVWKAWVRPDELMPSAPPPPVAEATPEPHFVERHREELIQRARNVNAVLDKLLGHGILSDEQYQKVLSEKTSQDKMRELFLLLPSWNNSCKDIFYEALESTNPFLIDDLEKRPPSLRGWGKVKSRARAHKVQRKRASAGRPDDFDRQAGSGPRTIRCCILH